MRTDDLIITVAYFSIPVQILVSLYHYPRLHAMPWYIMVLVVMFALFVLLCGAGHLLRCMGGTYTTAYAVVNTITAAVSLSTALYLLPLIPTLMSKLDHSIQDLIKLNEETEEAKKKLVTFMAFLCHEIRNPLFIITSAIAFMEDNNHKSSNDINNNGEQQQRQLEDENSLSLIKQSADLMLRLVNDVLDVTLLESGKVELQKQDFDLRQTLEGAATSAKSNIRENLAKQENKGAVLELRTNIAPEVPRFAHGDAVRILQVCLNLLSNATKFTEAGFIDFSVSVCDFGEALSDGHIGCNSDAEGDSENVVKGLGKSSTENDTADFSASLFEELENGLSPSSQRGQSDLIVLKITVVDTGCGIPSDQLERIFRPYSMAKLSEYRKQGGTGLGLAISSKIASIMNGTIAVRSTVGKGTVFDAYVVLERATLSETFGAGDNKALHPPPLQSMEEETPSSPPPTPPLFSAVNEVPLAVSSPRCPAEKTSSRRTMLPKFDFPPNDAVVLIVDDNAMNRKLLSRMLKGFNLEFLQACNGQEAVDTMLQSRNYTGNQNDPWIGFVLMDLSMPVMGGCQAIRYIRKKHGLVDVPIMALTAAAIEEGRNCAMDAGGTDYSTKPILRETLHAKCTKYIIPSTTTTSHSIDSVV